MKPLIVFAHYGEAQAFLKYYSPIKKKIDFVEYFESDILFFLISGEGGQQVNEKLIHLLAKVAYAVSDVFNFGVAGSLQDEVNLDNIYPIRTLYRYGESLPFFNSFTTAYTQESESKNGKNFKERLSLPLDIVSTDHRVLSSNFASLLKPFGHLVDMESYFIASVAKRYKKKLYVFKYTSDMAGENKHCLDIKNQGLKYSNEFLNYFLNHNQEYSKKIKNSLNSRNHLKGVAGEKSKKKAAIELSSAFYLTTSQKIIFDKLFVSISCDERLLIQLKQNIKMIEELNIAPKKRAKKLIEVMQKLNNPYASAFDRELKKSNDVFSRRGIRVNYKSSSEKILVQYEVKNKSQWEDRLIDLRDHFPKELFSYLDMES